MTATKPQPAPAGPQVISFGCRLNALEAEAMRVAATASGFGDVAIVNTCAVTGEAVRQARQTIRRIARDRPQTKIVVTGCAAQIDPDVFARMDNVDCVLGNDVKTDPQVWRTLDFSDAMQPRVRVNDIMTLGETAHHFTAGGVDRMEGRARAFVEVQNGCDHRCTFCIIPYGRGPSRSAPAGEVVEQVQRLVDNGYNEVVLTGVDITSWGADLPGRPTFGKLVRQILRHVPALPRLRISSIDCIEADPDLRACLAGEARLMPHLHLSLQAGDNMILKRMKRRHSREEAIAFCQDMRAARPGIAFGADIIVGFPTETEAMFGQSLDLVEACGLSFLHVFPFSPRTGTPAARMPQLDRAVIRDRAARLRALGADVLGRHLRARIGRRLRVVVERGGYARAEDFTLVRLAGAGGVPPSGLVPPGLIPGALVEVEAVGCEGNALLARLTPSAGGNC